MTIERTLSTHLCELDDGTMCCSKARVFFIWKENKIIASHRVEITVFSSGFSVYYLCGPGFFYRTHDRESPIAQFVIDHLKGFH